jgi:hypothetical protein
MDLAEIGSEDVDWINLIHGMVQWQALVKRVMNLQVS